MRTLSSLSSAESRLLKLSRDVTSTLDLQEVLEASFAALRELISFEGGAIALRDGDVLRLAATEPPATPEALAVRLPIGQGITGGIAVTGEPEYLPDIELDERVYPEGRKHATSPGVRSWFGVPLIMHGDPIGVLSIDSRTVDAFAEADRTLVLAFVPTITAAVQNALLFNRELQVIAELREAERLKDDFLAVVSHELRTPLTSIVGLADTMLLHTDALDRDTIADFAERIAGGSRRLQRVIEDVLNISQIERGALRVNLAPTSAPEVARAAILDSACAPERLALEVEGTIPLALADADRLYQIIVNLLDNARKFSETGTPIEIRVRAAGNDVLVQVRDRGRGISAGALPRVFERFYQVDQASTREAGGLGIGLYLAKHLAERMGGSLTAESEPGVGSTFMLLLRGAENTSIDLSGEAGSPRLV